MKNHSQRSLRERVKWVLSMQDLKDKFLTGAVVTEANMHELIEATHPDSIKVSQVSFPIGAGVSGGASQGVPQSWTGTFEVLLVDISSKVTLMSSWVSLSSGEFTWTGTMPIDIQVMAMTPAIAIDLKSKIPQWSRWIGEVRRQWSMTIGYPSNGTSIVTGNVNADFLSAGVKIQPSNLKINYSGASGMKQEIHFTGSEMFVLVDKS